MTTGALTEAQRSVLSEMEALNAEALWYAGQWWFRDDVRHTPELAERLVRVRRRLPRWPLAVPAQKTGL
jgi:hypothetical protein